MNPKKISFIICSNNDTFLSECHTFLDRLKVPDSFDMDKITITNAKSMLDGYRTGIKKTDALYKVFMHQDVFILNKYFIENILSIFDSDPNIGVIGMAGTKYMPSNFIMWSSDTLGYIYSRNNYTNYSNYKYDVLNDGYDEVEAVDGFLISTKGDPTIRDDLFDGWDFYDVSISMEARRKNKKVVVPRQNKPWCLHDDGDILSMLNYDHYRQVAIKEYFNS